MAHKGQAPWNKGVRQPVSVRFWAKVDKRGSDECWPWTANRDGDGYGQLTVLEGDRRTTEKAQRVSWRLANGPIPDGMLVLHRCDNPPCVNPAHLFLGTHRDNVADCDAKGRRAQATFDRRAADEVRRRHASGESQVSLAASYGTSRITIWRIVHAINRRVDERVR